LAPTDSGAGPFFWVFRRTINGTLKLKKVAIIDDRTAYGQGVADVFKATDFMVILTAIKSKKPDAIFLQGARLFKMNPPMPGAP